MKKLVIIALLAAMLLSCFVGCASKKPAAEEATTGAMVDDSTKPGTNAPAEQPTEAPTAEQPTEAPTVEQPTEAPTVEQPTEPPTTETDPTPSDPTPPEPEADPEPFAAVGIYGDLKTNLEKAIAYFDDDASNDPADFSVDVWDGTTVDTAWYQADKTEFTLTSGAQLMGFRQLMASNSFEGITVTLGKNINLNGAALEGCYSVFKGIFDGKGYVIGNYTMALTISGGFFGMVEGVETKRASLQNFALVKVTCFAESDYIGSVAGFVNGFSNVINVYSNATLDASKSLSYVGGMIGSLSTFGKISIANCEFGGKINTTSSVGSLGGIAGAVESGNVTFAYCATSIGAEIVSGGKAIGGMLGINESAGEVVFDNCVNNANVGGANSSLGGLVGQFKDTASMGVLTIKNSINNGSVQSEVNFNGGIIGVGTMGKELNVLSCTNNGVISGKGYSGGIVGGIYYKNNYTVHTIENCVNNGAVSITEGSAGGILGGISNKTSPAVVIIKSCENTAEVQGSSKFGPIVGDLSLAASATVENCTPSYTVGEP